MFEYHVLAVNVSQTSNLEIHLVMKNNAMFLLELSGTSSRTMKTSPPDMNTCFPNTGPLQCLHSLGVDVYKRQEEDLMKIY